MMKTTRSKNGRYILYRCNAMQSPKVVARYGMLAEARSAVHCCDRVKFSYYIEDSKTGREVARYARKAK